MNQRYRLPLFLFILCAAHIGCSRAQQEIPAGFYFPLPANPGEPVQSENQVFYLQAVADGLDIPWGMTFLPDQTILVTERKGTIRMIRNGTLLDDPLRGTPNVVAGGTGGLMDIAAHPDYRRNGWIYITYSAEGEDGATHTALMRAKLSGQQLLGREVLFTAQPMTSSPSHFGSRIAFQDGYVFFSTGDRGVPTLETAQDLSSHNGSILRLHDNGNVPSDNPFVNTEGAMPEIYSYGHRNPQGLEFDPETGWLWAHEHGPVDGDELNIIEKGANYGWPEISYGEPNRGSELSGDTAKAGLQPAVRHWTPAIAPSGLDFVSGELYPEWKGNMLISTLRGEMLLRLVLDGGRVAREEALLQGMGRLRNVRMGPDGLIYVANETTGEIVRLLPAALFNE
ncbi:MAG: PQQ-dependent sugar dehydrogenase [Balneolales bacterium]